MRTIDLTYSILKCVYKVHSELGPGLLESSYEIPLSYELKAAGFSVEQQKALPLIYKDIKMDVGYRVDLIVEDQVIIEVKSIAAIEDIHSGQLLTYLKLSNYKVGLLLNFNVSSMKNGIRRIVNKFDDTE